MLKQHHLCRLLTPKCIFPIMDWLSSLNKVLRYTLLLVWLSFEDLEQSRFLVLKCSVNGNCTDAWYIWIVPFRLYGRGKTAYKHIWVLCQMKHLSVDSKRVTSLNNVLPTAMVWWVTVLKIQPRSLSHHLLWLTTMWIMWRTLRAPITGETVFWRLVYILLLGVMADVIWSSDMPCCVNYLRVLLILKISSVLWIA